MVSKRRHPRRRCDRQIDQDWDGAGSMASQTQPHSQPPPPWSAIPVDLAILVLRLLHSHADRARFAAVCPQWRAAARQPLPPPLPLLALPDGTFYSLPYTRKFRFPGCGFAEYKGVCGGWLIFPRDDGCFLVDPFSGSTMTLPALSNVRLRPPNAVAKWSQDEGGEEVADPYVTWMHIHNSEKLHISKLIVCSQNLVAALVGIGFRSQILMCQPGASAWSVRAYDRCKEFEDMAFYRGKLYAIASDENLLVVNISQDQRTGDPQVCRIGQAIKGDPWYLHPFQHNTTACKKKKIYLVESGGALLMVRRAVWCRIVDPGVNSKVVAERNEFEVFEADFEHSQWIKVSTVGADQVLFLGRRCSRAISVSQYNDFVGDRIVFLDDDEQNRVDYLYDRDNSSWSEYVISSSKEVRSCHPLISWKRSDAMLLEAWLFPLDR